MVAIAPVDCAVVKIDDKEMLRNCLYGSKRGRSQAESDDLDRTPLTNLKGFSCCGLIMLERHQPSMDNASQQPYSTTEVSRFICKRCELHDENLGTARIAHLTMALKLKFGLSRSFAVDFDPMNTVTIALVGVCHSSPWTPLRFTGFTCLISMGGHGCH